MGDLNVNIVSDPITSLSEVLDEVKPINILLVTGRKSFDAMPVSAQIIGKLSSYNLIRYSDIESNPSVQSINNFKKVIDASKPELIVAIGGGSVLDTAKIGRYLHSGQVKLLVIPTTAGTGSESTQFATYYDGKTKKSQDDVSLLPEYVILSEVFTETLPRVVRAETGADAFCQAVESFWNINSTEISRQYAREAMLDLWQNLPEVVRTNNIDARKKVLIASRKAGMAINITRTTAAHSVSYPITSYFNVNHGQAVSVTLPYFFEFNLGIDSVSCADMRGHRFVNGVLYEIAEILGCDSVDDVKDDMLSFFAGIGLKVKLSNLIPSVSDIDTIVKNGFTPSRVKNNPRVISENDLIEILNRCFN